MIGDELLRGQVADANTSWLAKTLHAQGVDLTRVTFVPDEVSDIVDTVRDLRHRVGPGGFVFTAGGIGCTHDDVTYDAIAKAFDRTLERHSPTVERMREQYTQRGLELTEVRLRMATLPTPCGEGADGSWAADRLAPLRTVPTVPAAAAPQKCCIRTVFGSLWCTWRACTSCQASRGCSSRCWASTRGGLWGRQCTTRSRTRTAGRATSRWCSERSRGTTQVRVGRGHQPFIEGR